MRDRFEKKYKVEQNYPSNSLFCKGDIKIEINLNSSSVKEHSSKHFISVTTQNDLTTEEECLEKHGIAQTV